MCHVGAWLFCIVEFVCKIKSWSRHSINCFRAWIMERYAIVCILYRVNIMVPVSGKDSNIMIIPLLSLVEVCILHSCSSILLHASTHKFS